MCATYPSPIKYRPPFSFPIAVFYGVSRPLFQGAARKISVPAEWQNRDLGEPAILASGEIEMRAVTVR